MFRPNLDPDFVNEEEKAQEEGSKMKGTDFALDSDEDQEEEDKRIIRTARELNK